MLQRAEVTPKPERIKAVSDYLQSGKTMVAWSKERQINRFTLHNWVKEYRQETKPAEGEWVEFNVKATALDVVSTSVAVVEQKAATYTPIRISIDGLASLVKHRFKLDPFSSNLYVFCNRQKDKIKVLHWQETGFTLWYKRLERGRFRWPDNSNEVMGIMVG